MKHKSMGGGAKAQKSGSKGDSGHPSRRKASPRAGAGNIKGGSRRTSGGHMSGASAQKSGSRGG